MESLAPYNEFYKFAIEDDKVGIEGGTDFIFGNIQTTLNNNYIGKAMQDLIKGVGHKKLTIPKNFQPKLYK